MLTIIPLHGLNANYISMIIAMCTFNVKPTADYRCHIVFRIDIISIGGGGCSNFLKEGCTAWTLRTSPVHIKIKSKNMLGSRKFSQGGGDHPQTRGGPTNFTIAKTNPYFGKSRWGLNPLSPPPLDLPMKKHNYSYNLTYDNNILLYNFILNQFKVLVNPYCSWVSLLGPYFLMP